MLYGHKFSYVTRISGGYIGLAVLMIILPLITNALESPGAAFTADITILLFFGLIGGIT